MAMNEFEQLISDFNDIPRLLSETLQLENYLFSSFIKPPPPVIEFGFGKKIVIEKEPLNDLWLSSELLGPICSEVKKTRQNCVQNLLAFKPTKLVRGQKKKDVNLTLFYRRFPVFSALS
jgi:hypothetical protein